MAARRLWGQASVPADNEAARDAAVVEATDIEVAESPQDRLRASSAVATEYAQRRLRGEGPPDVKSPTLFLQRMTFETELLATIDQVKSIYIQWGYTFAYNWATYYWLYYVAEYFLRALSSQSEMSPTLYQRFKSREISVPFFDRPMEMLEMSLREARHLGLTLRTARPAHAALPRDKMLALIDPSRQIEHPEQIGVLQIAADIAEAAKERRDCFIVIDVSPRIRQFGAGKSQLLVQILAEANAMLGNGFDARFDIVYGEDHKRFRRLLNETTPEHAFGVDELDQFAYAREAMKGSNKETMQTLKQTRKWGRPIVACSASLWQLDPFLRDIKITHRVRIEEWDGKKREGRATVFEKGGFPDPPNDLWGRFPPIIAFDFMGLPAASYRTYYECAILASKAGGEGMDKFLRENPSWPEANNGAVEQNSS